jgi:DNA-binding transcriptional MerR regulator
MFLKIGELARRTGLTVRALRHHEDIALDDWLLALESMVAGSKYLRDDEQRRLRTQREAWTDAVRPQRAELSAWLQRLVATGVFPEEPEAQDLAQRWIGRLVQKAQLRPD